MYHIDIRFEDVLDRPLSWVDANLIAFEDSCDLDTITSLADIYELVIDAEGYGMRSLAIRYVIRCLLQLDNLFVGKSRSIMDDLHRIRLAACLSGTFRGFGNLAAVNVDLNDLVAIGAFEEGSFHVWDDGRRANDETFNADKLVHVSGVQLAKVDCLVKAERSNTIDPILCVFDEIGQCRECCLYRRLLIANIRTRDGWERAWLWTCVLLLLQDLLPLLVHPFLGKLDHDIFDDCVDDWNDFFGEALHLIPKFGRGWIRLQIAHVKIECCNTEFEHHLHHLNVLALVAWMIGWEVGGSRNFAVFHHSVLPLKVS